jgi:hypothetical protein
LNALVEPFEAPSTMLTNVMKADPRCDLVLLDPILMPMNETYYAMYGKTLKIHMQKLRRLARWNAAGLQSKRFW